MLSTLPASSSVSRMRAPAAAAAAPKEPRTREQLDEVRRQVRALLEQSPSFRALPADKQREIAHHTVEVCDYLAAPEGIPGPALAAAQAGARDRSQALAGGAARTSKGGGAAEGIFNAQAGMQGAAVAGAYLQAVNFPSFVAQLIQGVFHSIVQSSIEQMEAYGRLVQSVAMTLNQFRDENVTQNQGRDHLMEQFPDLFRLDIDTGEEGAQPRVRLRDGVDEDAALKRVNTMPVEGGPAKSLDDDTIEEKLVPAARTQLATSRQQLLATMVLMGINRIIVTDGRISAKVLFDFQARDNMKWAHSATKFDYGDQYRTTSDTEYESDYRGGETSDEETRDASWYYKGKYKSTAEPVIKLASASQAATDAALTTKANLSGAVEVNFRSETFPLDKMADSFQIGRIQDASKPGQVTAAGTGGGGTSAGGTAGSGGATTGGGGAAQTPAKP